MRHVRKSLIALVCTLVGASFTLQVASASDQAQYREQIHKQQKKAHQKAVAPGAHTTSTTLTTTTLSTTALSLPPGSQFQNGGFELGNFGGWTAGDNGRIGLMPWIVAQAAVTPVFSIQPREGLYDALNGFDGEAGYEAFLFQDVYVPPETPALSLYDRIQYESLGIPSTQPRIYEIQVRDPYTNAVLEVLHHQEVLLNGQPRTDLGWMQRQLPLTAYVGKLVRIAIQLRIAESWTGPAQIEFDDFRLVSIPKPADISGCLQESGKPLVGRTVLMNEYYLPSQSTVTDGKGCYVFQRVQPGSRYDIFVPGWLP